MVVFRPKSNCRLSMRLGSALVICLVVLGLSACQGDASSETANGETTASEESAAAQSAEASPNQTTSNGAASTAGSSGEVVEIEPLALEQSAPPVQIQIPAIELDLPIVPMGWQVANVDGTRTTVWNVPENEVGWHVNSAGAGGAGNTILSGRQSDGAAVFAPLALGSVAVGQDVLLTDEDGVVFLYRVTAVTEPIPIAGATQEDLEQAAQYLEQTGEPFLTLLTGWPEFTTTHRVFAIAAFQGVIQ